jgi:DNA glycosylase AlkZ-like
MGYTARMHLPLVVVPDDSEWAFRSDANFALAESWLGKPPATDERPHALVMRYLAAFGPASASDVQAWSALAGVREVLEELRPQLVSFRDDRKRELFDLPEAPRPSEETPAPARFLPGFDNLILSHADRTRIMADEHRPLVTTKNLLVLPTFLVDGFVAGTWKSSLAKKEARLTVLPFESLSKTAKAELALEADKLVRFIEPDAGKWLISFEAT